MAKTKKYFIRTINNELKEKEGKQVDENAFIYKGEGVKKWAITDIKTGCFVCNGKTQKQAIEIYQSEDMQEKIKRAYKNPIYKARVKEFKQLIKDLAKA